MNGTVLQRHGRLVLVAESAVPVRSCAVRRFEKHEPLHADELTDNGLQPVVKWARGDSGGAPGGIARPHESGPAGVGGSLAKSGNRSFGDEISGTLLGLSALAAPSQTVVVSAHHEQALHEKSLTALEALLPATFARVHRSYIANVARVRGIRGAELVLDDESVVRVGRRYREALRTRLFPN